MNPRIYNHHQVVVLKKPIYIERQRECCIHADDPDQFGIATHFAATQFV